MQPNTWSPEEGDRFRVVEDFEVEAMSNKVGPCTVCIEEMMGTIVRKEQDGSYLVSLEDFRDSKRFLLRGEDLPSIVKADDDEDDDDDFPPMGHDPWQGIQGDNHEMQAFQPTGGVTYRSGPQGPSMRGNMGMGMNREVFRSAPRGPIMGNDVFRSAPMARGAVPVYRGTNDQSDGFRGGGDQHMGEKWRSAPQGVTFRSARTGPQIRMNTGMPMSQAVGGKEMFRDGMGHGPVYDNKQGFKDNFGVTKEQQDQWNAVNPNGTMGGDADDMDDSEALPQAMVPQRQDCLSVDQRQRWLDARVAAFQRHMDAFKRNEHRMKDEEKKRVKPRLLAEKARLKAEQEDIDDDKKHIPRDPRDLDTKVEMTS